LKEIIKRSHLSDDASLLSRIVERLTVELTILGEDMSGEPNRWRTDRSKNDLPFCSFTLEKRQKMIKGLLSFLCYSIIKVDPANLQQQQNSEPNSNKILDSRIFEDYLKILVFDQN
jgi:hypothetical protein